MTRRRRSGRNGPGAGRPAKCYEVTDKEIRLQYPARRFDLLADLLVEVLETIDPKKGPEVAEQVGRRYGMKLAAEIGMPTEAGFEAAVAAVARTLTGVGFEASADPDGRSVVYRSCPFGQTAVDHPEVVCALDKGIVTGLLEAFHQKTGHCGHRPSPHARRGLRHPRLGARVRFGRPLGKLGRRLPSVRSTMPAAFHDPFSARTIIETPLGSRTVYRLDALKDIGDIDALPYTIKVLLEAVLRNHDGV